MRSLELLVLAVLIPGCTSSSQKPFDEMTAQEHLAAAAREHQLAAGNLARVSMENIEPPETLTIGPFWGPIYEGAPGSFYDPYIDELGSPEFNLGWPRVSDPSEKYEDAASEHRENAMRHERAAALLEGRPSPQPLPPVRSDVQLLDSAG